MTFLSFCAQQFISVSRVRSFAAWLADIKNNRLPEAEWWKLWGEFNK